MTNEQALDILQHNWTKLVNPDCTDEELGQALDLAIKALEERPKGDWIFIDILEDDNFPMDKGSEIYECSVCGRRIWTFSLDLTDFYPFCHCGADMRKGAEE